MASEHSDIRFASRAFKEAVTALTAAFRQSLADAGTQATREVTDELRQATKELDDAVAIAGLKLSGQRRTTRADHTRAELLAAARQVFAEKGYEGASVGDIATAAGYTKGAVYAHFDSKEELLLALVRELTNDDAALATTPVEDLPKLLSQCQTEGDSAEQTLLGMELYLYAIRNPEARSEITPLLVAAQNGIANLVHRHRSTNDSATNSKDADAPTQDDRDIAFALAALSTFAGIVAPLLPDADGPNCAAAIVRRLSEQLLRGSGGRGGRVGQGDVSLDPPVPPNSQ